MIDFISSNRISDSEGFSNSVDGPLSYDATFYALEILKDFNEINYYVDSIELSELFGSIIDYKIDDDAMDLYDLYYLLSSINTLGQINNIIISNSSLNGKIINYLNQTNLITGGFSMTNTSSYPIVISTFLGIKCYEIINQEMNNALSHINWLLTCNNTDGGFGGNSTAVSSISSTNYAVLALNSLDSFNNLTSTTKEKIIQYAKSFYLSNGGYKPDTSLTQTVIWSTYYNIKIISMVSGSEYNDRLTTINWILDRQNTLDGGFSDPSTGIGSQNSSMSTSYNAYQTLKILNALDSLNSEIGLVEFNWYVLLGILVAIGFTAGLIFFLWKRRQI